MPTRPALRHLLRIAQAAAMALVPVLAASAADWRYREAQTTAPRYLTGFVTATDGSIWSWNDSTVYRTDEAGNTRVEYRGNVLGTSALALADGSVVLGLNTCEFLHAYASARPPRRFTQPDCMSVSFNTDGSFWAAGATTLYLVGLDGVRRTALRIGAQESLGKIAALPDGGVLAQSQAGNATQRRLSRFDARGQRVWDRVEPGRFTFAPAADGGAFVVRDGNNRVSVTRLGADGAVAWSRDTAAFAEFVMQAGATSDNALYVVGGRMYFNLPQPTALLHISSDGATAWDQPLCGGEGSAAPLASVAFDGDGNSAVACSQDDTHLLRRDRRGNTLARVPLPFVQLRQAAFQPDGALRLLGYTFRPDRSRLIDIDRESHISPTGADQVTDAAPSPLQASAIDSEGSSYLLAAQVVSKISPDGRLLWRTDAPAFQLHSAALNVAGGQVCATQHHSIPPGDGNSHLYTMFCLDTASGSLLWRAQTPPGSNDSVTMSALDGGGSVTLIARRANYSLYRRDRTATVVRETSGTGQVHSVHLDRQGRAFLLVGTTLVHYAADGQRRYEVPAAVPGYPTTIASDDDGNVYVVGREEQQVKIWAVDASGATRWQQTLEGLETGKLLLADGAVYAMQFGRLTRFAADTGARQWRYDSTNPQLRTHDTGGVMALSASGDAVVLAYSWGDRLRFERIDARTGIRLSERFAACGISCDHPMSLALDADGSARTLLTALDGAGQTATAMALSGIASDAPGTRLDQPGIAGAWWSPYANGEGITFDWLPASRTLFGAWFTYSTQGGNDPAELRWYTVQANGVAPNATRLELPILETTGGSFASGPAVLPRQVGSAKITFTDCNNGILDYVFDTGHNDGRRGTITLSRLSPATQACVLADGSTIPGSGAQPPANGFDAKLSGRWFDETTAGQGLQLTVQPDGVFFAPWFTFDPADAGNDAGRQHWFTLQGNLADARNGTAELVLVQSIGGVFDRVPTYNANAVGTATLRVQGCDRAELDYGFADESVAGAFRARSGTLRLTRAGGCAAAP
jgi:outer membrane protein assembly factor BamB